MQQAQATPPTVVKAQELPSTPDTPPSTEVTLGELLKMFAQAIASRNWGQSGCTLVLGAVYVVRRFGASRVPWLGSDAAGVALSLLAAAALQLSAALASGTPLRLSLVLGILRTAAGASGLFSWGTKLKAARQPVLSSSLAASTEPHRLLKRQGPGSKVETGPLLFARPHQYVSTAPVSVVINYCPRCLR